MVRFSPIAQLTFSAELAQAAAYPEPPSTRSQVLRAVNFDESFLTSDIAIVPFSTANGTLLGDAVGAVAAATPKRDREAEHEQALRRLRNNLLLSSKIVYPEDTLPTEAAEAGPTVDELFAEAAGQLSLNDRAPNLAFAVLPLPPHLAPPDTNGDRRASTPQSLDARSAHTLLLDWKLGADPRQHEWKSPHHSSSPTSPPRRERTNLPVSHFTSQPSIPRLGAPPISRLLPQSSPARRFPTPPVATESVRNPTFGRTPSSPTVFSDHDFPQTQIERGAYGARPEVATKASKKRATKRRHGF